MNNKIISRIDMLNTQIEKLKIKKQQLTNDLSNEVIVLLKQRNALSYDFETLIGGLLSVLDTLKNNDDASINQKQIWKKNGGSHFRSTKRTKKSKAS